LLLYISGFENLSGLIFVLDQIALGIAISGDVEFYISIVKGYIEQILKKIREEEDLNELQYFKKLVKKNVPFFLRGYFAAKLFKDTLKKLPQERPNFTTLFISTGRNRHVFPHDLKNLFTEKLKISDISIGDIRVFESYSFVEIATPLALKAIDLLSNSVFMGRKIIVNFSRKKPENGTVRA